MYSADDTDSDAVVEDEDDKSEDGDDDSSAWRGQRVWRPHAVPRPHLEVDPRQADRRRVPGLERALVPEAEVRGQVEGPEHLPPEGI